MNDSRYPRSRLNRGSQDGFTLIELMVSMTIALFLLGGLLATVQSTRRAYTSQNLFSQMQDNERLAMSLLANTIESTGYYSQPQLNTAGGIFVASNPFLAGQVIVGSVDPTNGETISVRYAGLTGENVFACNGVSAATDAAGHPGRVENTFFVSGNQLICQVGGTNYPLVTTNVTAGVTTLGVKSMSVYYGVQLGGASTGSCSSAYLTTAQMVADGTLWNSVCSVRITLNFVDPTKPTSQIPVSRVIAIMNTAGV